MNSRPGEFELISKHFAPLAGKGSFGFRDDASEITPKSGNSLVITQDSIAEGVHFFGDDDPALIARKALRVNISDIAAKGASPRYFSLSLGLGKSWNEAWIEKFAKGLKQEIRDYNLDFTGGDTFSTGAGFVISLTMIGETPQGDYVSRLGAGVDDLIYVSGTIGDGALGLLARQGKLTAIDKDDIDFLLDRYLVPRPRVELSQLLRMNASSAMDISDGLIGDMEKLCSASGVGAQLDLAAIPLSRSAKNVIEHDSDYMKLALTGGDDYEILFTIPPEHQKSTEDALSLLDCGATLIGQITSASGVRVLSPEGKTVSFEKTGYDHSGADF